MFSLWTVFLSVLLSAVVALLTAGWVVHRQESAREHIAAIRELRAILRPMRGRIETWRAGLVGTAPLRAGQTSYHVQDAQLIAGLLVHAERLPGWRQKLIVRRLERLFGNGLVNLAAVDPGAEQFAMELRAFVARSKGDLKLTGVAVGTLDAAFRDPQDDGKLERVRRDLRRLSNGW